MHELFNPSFSYIPDFFFEVARGNVPNTSYEHKFGLNQAVGTTFETVWTESTAYAYLAAATVLKISSSDANDTSAGTGAQTINIKGLDANYDEINEDVILAGQTAVNTTKSFLRVHRMTVETAGTSNVNVGKIYAGTGTVTAGVPANKYGVIDIGYGQTLMGLFTIPAGFTGFLYSFDVTSSISRQVSARVYVRALGGAFQSKDVIDITEIQVRHNWQFPLQIEGKSDIEVQAKAAAGGGSLATTFTLLLVKLT